MCPEGKRGVGSSSVNVFFSFRHWCRTRAPLFRPLLARVTVGERYGPPLGKLPASFFRSLGSRQKKSGGLWTKCLGALKPHLLHWGPRVDGWPLSSVQLRRDVHVTRVPTCFRGRRGASVVQRSSHWTGRHSCLPFLFCKAEKNTAAGKPIQAARLVLS